MIDILTETQKLGFVIDAKGLSRLSEGKVQRYPVTGDGPGQATGWGVKLESGAMMFGNWRTGKRWVFDASRGLRPSSNRPYGASDKAGRKTQPMSDAEREASQQRAALEARSMWENHRHAQIALEAHPYLKKKGLPPFDCRLWSHDFMVPMRDEHGALHNVQRIFPDGTKRFLSGGRCKGLYWSWGDPSRGEICIGEGWATMAAIHMATGHFVVAALAHPILNLCR